jgi:hypothetical protein
MKGGKEGRKRKTSSTGVGRSARAHGKAKQGVTKRLASAPPKKGSRKKAYGGTSTAGEE